MKSPTYEQLLKQRAAALFYYTMKLALADKTRQEASQPVNGQYVAKASTLNGRKESHDNFRIRTVINKILQTIYQQGTHKSALSGSTLYLNTAYIRHTPSIFSRQNLSTEIINRV